MSVSGEEGDAQAPELARAGRGAGKGLRGLPPIYHSHPMTSPPEVERIVVLSLQASVALASGL